MSETEMNYMAKFSLDTSDISKGLTGAAISFDAISIAAKEAFAMVKEGYDMTVDVAMEFAASMDEMKNITGESFENLQRLRGAAIATDTDFASVSGTLRIFSTRLGDTGTSGDTLRAKLEAIGVQLYDNNGQYRSAAELMMDVNAKAGAMTNTYERNNLLADIYGRSWYNISEMIVRADSAAQGWKKTEIISDADIEKARAYQDRLNELGEKLNKLQVDLGMWVMDDSRFKALTGDIAPDSILGMILGIKGAPGVAAGAAGTDYAHTLKEQTEIIAPLIDKYAGMNDVQMSYLETQNQIAIAQADYDKALTGTSQSALDTASMNLQGLKNKYAELRQEMYATATAAQVAAAVIANPFYDPGSIENQGVTDGGTISGMMQSGAAYGVAESSQNKYRSVNAAFAMANASTDTSNSYLNQLRALSAEAAGSGAGNGYDWSHTSSATSISDRTLSSLNAYNASQAPVQNVTVIVSPNFSASAQEIASATAEATSRELARQATL